VIKKSLALTSVHDARADEDEGREAAATKAREGVNPFTGEKMMFKASRRARRFASCRQSLKGMVSS
jgi:hypothetical protein